MTNCWLTVDGDRFADTAGALESGDPTALSDVEVVWGRSNTVDQPEAATARFTVLDRSGGTRFVDVIPIGVPVDVWATGDISTHFPTETFPDPGFETLDVGPAGNRVSLSTGTATIVATPTASGTRALQVATTPPFSPQLRIPPDSFSTDVTAWDSIPRIHFGQVWTWSVKVRAGYGVQVNVIPISFRSPLAADPIGSVGVAVGTTGDLTWQTVEGITSEYPNQPDQWVGLLAAIAASGWNWTQTPGTWAEASGRWVDYTGVTFDDVSVVTRGDELFRDVLIFSGRVTDLSATVDVDGTVRVAVVAIDQLADLQNRFVGDQPWPIEMLYSRVVRIVNLSGADTDIQVDAGLDTLAVSRRDVDNQPAGTLLAELSSGVDGVLWSATHAATGPYLWIENTSRRAILATLAVDVDGLIQIIPITGTHAPTGRSVLDGATLPQGEVTWTRDVTDVVTRVDATWQEQTTPDLTERTVRVVDTAAEALYGARRLGLSTPLTAANDATDVANRILTRSRRPPWRTEGLTYDAGLTPPAPGDETSTLLDLLDGTRRIGRGVVVTNVERWPGGSTAGYLDGGRYRYDGAWLLQLVTTPMSGVVDSGPWTSLDPAWRWDQFAPEIAWLDLYGVTGPIVELEGV